MLIDSHCHLDYLERDGRDLAEIVATAQRAGVERLVTICTKVTEFERVRAIAERFEPVTCSVGIHPHEAGAEPETSTEQLVDWAQHPKVVGIGETGLDYFYEHSPRDAQQKSFRAHIRAARATGLPLIVHTRDADDDTLRVMDEEYRDGGPFPGLIHCFSAGREVAEKAVAMGLYISISGIVTFKNAEDLRETVKDVPLDRLLVETDSPFLAPIPNRGKRNEPAFTALTAAKVAEIKGISPDELARQTTDNFFTLFAKAAEAVRGAE